MWLHPAPTASLTSKYGMRTVMGVVGFHYGIDLAQKGDVPIYASKKGKVYKVINHATYGHVIFIQHEDAGARYDSVYAHLRAGTIKVSIGQEVSQGQQLALMGSTGRSTGQHLHFEIHKGAYKYAANNIDPWPLIQNNKDIQVAQDYLLIENLEPSCRYYRVCTSVYSTKKEYTKATEQIDHFLVFDRASNKTANGYQANFLVTDSLSTAQSYAKDIVRLYGLKIYIHGTKKEPESIRIE